MKIQNPGFVILQKRPSLKTYEKAVREIVSLEETEQLLKSIGAEYRGYKNCRGLIGATASIAWYPAHDKTYELITYRQKKSWGTERFVDDPSVKKMDKTCSSTFDNHDHNWEVTVEAALNFGWYWGKINSDTYTIVWSDILTTWYWDQPLIVISENNGGYQNIERDDIQLEVGDLRLTNWMLIPHSFDIAVQTENVSLNVHMQSLDVHYDPLIGGIMNYWRYHLKCTGFITVGSHTELIDDVVMAEFLRFRPY